MQNDIKYLLKPDSIIYTRCCDSDEWLPNIIKDNDDSSIRINLNDYYIEKGLMVGDAIEVRFSYSHNEYLFDGKIIDIDIYNTYTINVLINSVNIFEDKRKHFRFYAKLGASLKASDTKGMYSIVTNISLGGLALVSKSDIDIDTTIVIDLFLSSKNVIPITGIIVRKKPLTYGYEYGIAIVSSDESSHEKLKEFISKLSEKYNYHITK